MLFLSLLSVASAVNSYAAFSKQNMRANPISALIDLLQKMHDKGTGALAAEQDEASKFELFCHGTSVDVKNQIETYTSTVEDSKLTIEALNGEIETKSKEKEAHLAQVALNTQDLANAEKIRQAQNADFVKMDADYAAAIDAIGRAADFLQSQNYDREQARALFLQVRQRASKISKAVELPTPPEANAYEFQSADIIKTLENLKEKFIAERTSLQKTEATEAHNYNMFQLDLTKDSTDRAKSVKRLTGEIGNASTKLGDTKKLLAETEVLLSDAQNYLNELTGTCAQRKSAYEQRFKLREEELQMILKVIDIVGGESVSGNAQKHDRMGVSTAEPEPEFGQIKAHVSFAQFFSKNSYSPMPTSISRVEALLSAQSKSLKSNALSSLLSRLSVVDKAHDYDPIGKVVGLIKDLIARLKQEAADEQTQKVWCDANLARNKEDRERATDLVTSLEAQCSDLEAKIVQTTKAISDLNDAIANLTAERAQMQADRASRKALNEEAIADAKDAQSAVANALVVMREFYERAGKSTAFISQRELPAIPEGPDAPYTGMGAESGGVLGMLQVIQSDFGRLQAETEAQEAQDAESHRKYMSDSAVSLAEMKTTLTHKIEMLSRHKSDLSDKQNDLNGARAELAAANETFQKLQGPCVRPPVNYENRVAQREAEIKSLKECLEILSTPNA